ncbi:MAG: helix-turn-helix domain-containing protein [Verrucomicrobia bacterium]|nr:helix-turn-helix domain-containing protein [Verrucomicrobiota bacterium]
MVIVFNVDMMNPWVPGIYRGLEESLDGRDIRLRLGVYHQHRLLHWERELQQTRFKVNGWITDNQQEAEICYQRGLPCVLLQLVEDGGRQEKGASISSDYHQMGLLAAEELLRCGYERFAIILSRHRTRPAAKLKSLGFAEGLSRVGADSRQLEIPNLYEDNGWMAEMSVDRLTEWLKQQKTSIGLAGVNVPITWGVYRALRRIKVKIPERVTLMAIGDDPVLLTQPQPMITGMAEDSHRIGTLSGEFLLKQMGGESVTGHHWVPPLKLSRRASTQYFQAEDPMVHRALQLIWNGIDCEHNVDSLAKALHVSRATLLRRFKVERGHSPSEELAKAKVRKATELLLETRIPIAEIAEMTGYGLHSAFCHAIKRATGKTPGELRQCGGKA